MIKLQVIGHLGRDCVQGEVSGKTVLNFNVAHSERYKDQMGNLKEKTTWVSCAYWTDKTGIAPYLVRGQQVYVEGIPDVEIYTNKENQPTAALRLRVFNVQLLGSKGDTQGGQEGTTSPADAYPQSASGFTNRSDDRPGAQSEPDDLPF